MRRATELVAHRSSHSPSSLRRVATAAIGIMLLLVAAAAFASSHPSPSSLVAHAEALPTHQQPAAAETSPAPVASPAKRLSPKTITTEGSAYVNAFSGREKIGKGSHEDFSKVAFEMIKKLDKELPTLSHRLGSTPTAPVEHWSDQQVHIKNLPVQLKAQT